MTRLRHVLTATAVAGALALAGGLWVGTAEAGSPRAGTAEAGSSDPGAPGRDQVAAVHYTLGDAAFQVPGFHADPEKPELADLELTGMVHYPKRLTGRHPLVVVLHGQWWTCVNGSAPALRWPCAKGTAILPSYRGHDYLGRNLASRGFVVVSISANGVNAGELGDPADAARAALINKHLAMWKQLTDTGRGPLAGRLTDPGTGTPRRVDFTGALDMTRVGTLGHSRGGRGVMWQAAAKHRAEWPAGVRIRAALPLAPAGMFDPENPEVVANYQLTDVPFLQWEGMCDNGAHGEYFDVTAKGNRATSRQLDVHGANHNFLNTQWSPSSGQAGAEDDADRGPRPRPGLCTTVLGAPTAERQLTEDEERRVATGYASAFFRRYLTGDAAQDRILDGKELPYATITKIDLHSSGR